MNTSSTLTYRHCCHWVSVNCQGYDLIPVFILHTFFSSATRGEGYRISSAHCCVRHPPKGSQHLWLLHTSGFCGFYIQKLQVAVAWCINGKGCVGFDRATPPSKIYTETTKQGDTTAHFSADLFWWRQCACDIQDVRLLSRPHTEILAPFIFPVPHQA